MRDIHFANPAAAYYFVIGLLFVALFAYSLSMRKRALLSFADQLSLQRLLFLEKRTLYRYLLLGSAWFFAALALMQPQRVKTKDFSSDVQKETLSENLNENTSDEKVVVKRRACDVIFLVDASASMAVRDTRMGTSRLNYAKEIMDQVISQMDGQNVALYAFTSEVSPIVPPTLDYLFTRMMLKNIKINEGDIAGTDLLVALERIGKKHFSKAKEKQTVLVLLTDGGDTFMQSLAGKERENQIALILDKVKVHQDQKINVYTVGLGTKSGETIPDLLYEGQPVVSSLDSDLLTEVSDVGHGKYFFANDYSALEISESILSAVKENSVYVEEEVSPKHLMERSVLEKTPQNQDIIHYYQIPLTLALFLLGLEMLMPAIPVRRGVLQDE